MQPSEEAYRTSLGYARDIIRNSHHMVALTGAGISTPSGIPDFRSTDSGLWEQYDPFEVASLNAFRYHPEKFFNWMRPLATKIKHAAPNPAHRGLAWLEEQGFLKTIITQNIDGLHKLAGSKNVIEIHGSIDTLTCIQCYRQSPATIYLEDFISAGKLPYCNHCQGLLKPDVILFGEQIPSRAWLEAQEASRRCDLMLVSGSSLEVLPVAGLPMRAIENGARLIIINQTPTYIDVRADVVFTNDVASVIPRLADEVLCA